MYRWTVAALTALLLAGCGSITRGTSEDVAINATPTNTAIHVSNGMTCTTSCVLKIPRNQSVTVTASHPGYQTETVQVRTRVSGGGAAGMAGNVLAGGVIGMGVDAATGAMMDHYPNPVTIELEPNGVPQKPVVVDPPKAVPARTS